MTVPDQPFAAPAPPELRVDVSRVIGSLKQRLIEEIAKSVMLEAALADAQQREASLSATLLQMQQEEARRDQAGS